MNKILNINSTLIKPPENVNLIDTLNLVDFCIAIIVFGDSLKHSILYDVQNIPRIMYGEYSTHNNLSKPTTYYK